jgi:shikimate dehydrogenase
MSWRLGVVGSPISHSLSPRLHAEGLHQAGLEGTSETVEVQASEVERLRELITTQFDALSVTMPLKSLAAGLCDNLDDVAIRTGVVNSLLLRDKKILGACTDGRGFVAATEAQFDLSLSGLNVVILGAGGAARGIVDALVYAGVDQVLVDGRSKVNVDALTDRYDNVFTYEHKVDETDLLINTTPAAAREQTSEVQAVRAGAMVVDIAYEPSMTPWRSLYEDAGCRTTNGLGMLAYQAALQMTWWWNIPIDGAALLEVLQ